MTEFETRILAELAEVKQELADLRRHVAGTGTAPGMSGFESRLHDARQRALKSIAKGRRRG